MVIENRIRRLKRRAEYICGAFLFSAMLLGSVLAALVV